MVDAQTSSEPGAKAGKPWVAPAVVPGASMRWRVVRGDSVRLLLMGWCLWLVACWLFLTMGPGVWFGLRTGQWWSAWRGPMAVTEAVSSGNGLGPLQVMVVLAGVGWWALYPALRLSQGVNDPRHAMAMTMMDYLSMTLVWQAVIWPLAISARWTTQQTWMLNFSLMAWALLASGVVAVFRMRQTASARSGAMAVILSGLMLEPLICVVLGLPVGAQGGLWRWLSPWRAAWALSDSRLEVDPSAWVGPTLVIACTAALVWLAAAWRTHRLPVPDAAKAQASAS